MAQYLLEGCLRKGDCSLLRCKGSSRFSLQGIAAAIDCTETILQIFFLLSRRPRIVFKWKRDGQDYKEVTVRVASSDDTQTAELYNGWTAKHPAHDDLVVLVKHLAKVKTPHSPMLHLCLQRKSDMAFWHCMDSTFFLEKHLLTCGNIYKPSKMPLPA